MAQAVIALLYPCHQCSGWHIRSVCTSSKFMGTRAPQPPQHPALGPVAVCTPLITPAQRMLPQAAHLTQLSPQLPQLALPRDLVITEGIELSMHQQGLAPQHGHDDMLREVCRACHSLQTLLKESKDAKQGSWAEMGLQASSWGISP